MNGSGAGSAARKRFWPEVLVTVDARTIHEIALGPKAPGPRLPTRARPSCKAYKEKDSHNVMYICIRCFCISSSAQRRKLGIQEGEDELQEKEVGSPQKLDCQILRDVKLAEIEGSANKRDPNESLRDCKVNRSLDVTVDQYS